MKNPHHRNSVRARRLFRFYLVFCLAVMAGFTGVFTVWPQTVTFLTAAAMGSGIAAFGMFAAYYNGIYYAVTGESLWF
ncbi:MAG: hypothetical protein WC989_06055 [Micavibrio sp.]